MPWGTVPAKAYTSYIAFASRCLCNVRRAHHKKLVSRGTLSHQHGIPTQAQGIQFSGFMGFSLIGPWQAACFSCCLLRSRGLSATFCLSPRYRTIPWLFSLSLRLNVGLPDLEYSSGQLTSGNQETRASRCRPVTVTASESP